DPGEYEVHRAEGFIRDPQRWVIFPKLSVRNHARIEERNAALTMTLSSYSRNHVLPACGSYDSRLGVVTHGVSYMYTRDAFTEGSHPDILRVAVPFPFPEILAADFLRDKDEVLCVEELDPVIERALIYVCGKYGLSTRIRGKMTGDMPLSGENTPDSVAAALSSFLGNADARDTAYEKPAAPPLPVRPPVLCAGCPHRASFYAVKQAMKGKKAFYGGDIGCYTLGNAQPLDMCDTCLCMGAGINIAQGIWRVEPDTKCFAFVGDSTFFASGITGVINAFYNKADLTVVILDNSTTAMTGHQPHPGTGRTVMGEVTGRVSIEAVLRAVGLTVVETVDPLDLTEATETVKRVADEPGVKAIVFRSPCIAIEKSKKRAEVKTDICIGCRRCIRELGCPALRFTDGKAGIDSSSCTGCMICGKVCPVDAIVLA
ncbi:MAG: thiamine pyrophosphate-dependent enzyme, partial [Lachnospiraceae bacterium]|nr:thiamine pyrophosphate-dependent enzyme [Lachnospiraceae bacterium]